MKKRYLILADGTVYEGLAFGADAACTGELVFTTVVCNYNEVLCDPCYSGQIVVQTFPLVGNFGMVAPECHEKCHLSGYIVRECCEEPSNFRCEGKLDVFLKARNIPGIMDVDTRAITRHIRNSGVMGAMIADAIPEDMNKTTDILKNYAIKDAVAQTACTAMEAHASKGLGKAVVMDFGARRNIVDAMLSRGLDVTVLPANASAGDILACNPDGLILSDGPGDPAENAGAIQAVRSLLGKLPIFGVSLGHQILALACGAQVEKLKYGHRGGNQPVKDAVSGRCLITSQNHGYCVVSESVQGGEIRYANANDGSCEGIVYPGIRAMSVQFLPETESFIYDEMTATMGVK